MIKLLSLPKIFKALKRLIILFALINIAGVLPAQVDAKDEAVATLIPNIAYSFQWSGGDVAKSYGYNSNLGGGFMFKTKKNLLFSIDANFIFGDQVKNADSILSMVLTNNGYIIDGNGVYAQYNLSERGYNINFRVGKVLKVLQANPNSGLLIMGGIGYLVHRMQIDVQNESAPQIIKDYAKGYDRLTGGFSFNEFIGYFYMGRTRVLNFYGGLEFYQAFTKSQRDYVFDRMEKDNNNYQDFFFGIKIGWMIPVYNRAPDPYYYN